MTICIAIQFTCCEMVYNITFYTYLRSGPDAQNIPSSLSSNCHISLYGIISWYCARRGKNRQPIAVTPENVSESLLKFAVTISDGAYFLILEISWAANYIDVHAFQYNTYTCWILSCICVIWFTNQIYITSWGSWYMYPLLQYQLNSRHYHLVNSSKGLCVLFLDIVDI